MVNIDRNTPILLPRDLRDSVRDDDLFHFNIDALTVLDVSAARLNQRGTGDEQISSEHDARVANLLLCASPEPPMIVSSFNPWWRTSSKTWARPPRHEPGRGTAG